MAVLFAALLLAACAHEDDLAEGIRVPIKLSVMTGNSQNSRTTPGDPGEPETFDLPQYAYIYILAYSQTAEQGDPILISPGSLSPANKGQYHLEPSKWKQDAYTPEIYHYENDISIMMPQTMQSGRVYAAVSSKPLELGELPDTPDNTHMSQLTYSVPAGTTEEQNAYMKNLYSTPYNLVYAYDAGLGKLTGSPLPPEEENKTDKLYYGTILDAAEKVSHLDIILYHVAARLDVKWEVAADKRNENALTFFEIQHLPQSACYLFRPTENVKDETTSTQSYSATQSRPLINSCQDDGNLNPATYWQGREVVYVPQHHLVNSTGKYYPFDVRMGKNGIRIEADTDTPVTGKYYGQKAQFVQPFTPDPVFTSWIAVGVNINTHIDNGLKE